MNYLRLEFRTVPAPGPLGLNFICHDNLESMSESMHSIVFDWQNRLKMPRPDAYVGLGDRVQPAPMSSAGFRLAPISDPDAAATELQRAWWLLASVNGQVDRVAAAPVSLDMAFLLWLVDPADTSATAFREVLACLRRTRRPTGTPYAESETALTREDA